MLPPVDFKSLWCELIDRLQAQHETTLIEKERALLGDILSLMNNLYDEQETDKNRQHP